MDKKIIELAKSAKAFDPAALLAFIEVETGGRGFDETTGKIIIQFEGGVFRKRAKADYDSYIQLAEKNALPLQLANNWVAVLADKVGLQAAEWKAFNAAFAINKTAALESTSIGLGQIMGFHWARLGYMNAGGMWDDAKTGIPAQFGQLLKFLMTDTRLKTALDKKDWHTVATLYNGKGYNELAKRLGRTPYNESLAFAYSKYLKV